MHSLIHSASGILAKKFRLRELEDSNTDLTARDLIDSCGRENVTPGSLCREVYFEYVYV
jgi:hypothetical protein